jgi:hypothetical protein
MSKGKLCEENIELARTVHTLLEVFDEIVLQNRQAAIDDFLITLFTEREDTFKYLKHYAGQLLLNNEIEKEITRSCPEGKYLVKKYRIRIVKHFQASIELLRRKMDTVSPGGVVHASEILRIIELLKKFEFLILPVSTLPSCCLSSLLGRLYDAVLTYWNSL